MAGATPNTTATGCQLKLARAVRYTDAQAIEGYLNYCRGNGLRLFGFAGARQRQ